MARRPQGVQSFVRVGTGIADAVIKAAPGKLYSVVISWTNGTVDDLIRIHDCATVAEITANNFLFAFRISATVGHFPAKLPDVGLEALNGMVFNLQASGIKLDINIGFD